MFESVTITVPSAPEPELTPEEEMFAAARAIADYATAVPAAPPIYWEVCDWLEVDDLEVLERAAVEATEAALRA